MNPDQTAPEGIMNPDQTALGSYCLNYNLPNYVSR